MITIPWTELFGTAAAILTTVSFLPQVIKTLTSRDTSGISLIMYIAFVSGVTCWAIYGVLRSDIPILAANIVTFVLAATVLAFKITNVVQGKDTKKPAYDIL